MGISVIMSILMIVLMAICLKQSLERKQKAWSAVFITMIFIFSVYIGVYSRIMIETIGGNL